MTADGSATRIKDLQGWQGDASLYRLSPPLATQDYDYEKEEYEEVNYEYVVVSAAVAMFSGPETYIFPGNPPEESQPADWIELDGSFRGGLDHAQALANVGYSIVQGDDDN